MAPNTLGFVNFLFLFTNWLIVIPCLMLLELTSGLLFVLSTTAPPHYTAILTLMSSARPVIVICFIVLFVTYLTYFDIPSCLEALVLHSFDSFLQSYCLLLIPLHLLFETLYLIQLTCQSLSQLFFRCFQQCIMILEQIDRRVL